MTGRHFVLRLKQRHAIKKSNINEYGKGKALPLQAWTGLEISSRLRLPRFQDNRHMEVVIWSALRTGRLYPPGNTPGAHFCCRLSRPQGHSAAGRIMSMKNLQ